MSDRPPQTGLGLSDLILDPEILTKEIDHDFFDDPPEATSSIDFKECQQQGNIKEELPNKEGQVERDSSRFGVEQTTTISEQCVARLGQKSFRGMKDNLDELTNDSGRSSSNMTVQMEMRQLKMAGKEEVLQNGLTPAVMPGMEAEAEFYTMHQSNATSPNYPRPKQCYQLQQQRRSIGNIKKPTLPTGASRDQQVAYPINQGDCDLGGVFGDDELLSSSSDGSSSLSDSDLSDSSESELESLGSDDEEFVDMLEKYFDYIDTGSDCSDLTEVSPLSSLATSPVPPLFQGEDEGNGDVDALIMMADMKLMADNKFCSAPVGNGEEGKMEELSPRAADVVYDRSKEEHVEIRYGKPKLPLFISTTESIILPANGLNGKDGEEDEEDDPATTLEELEVQNMLSLKGTVEVAGTSPDLAHSKNCLTEEEEGEGSLQTFNFSSSSVPVKEEPFSRSSSSTLNWSLSSSSGIENGEKGRITTSSGSTSATSSNGSTSRSSGNGGGAGKRLPKNYTFTPDQMRTIERENHILLRKILDANSRNQHYHDHRHRNGHVVGHPTRHHHYHHHHNHKVVSSTASTRLRQQQKRIEHENNILMKRLQNVKPSKEIVQAFEKPTATKN